jgi:hypothetical protein
MLNEPLGRMLLLGLMVWVLWQMVSVLVGWRTEGRRYERAPIHWWPVLQWVPIGYSTARLLGAGTPVTILIVACVLMAVVQRIFARPFEIVIGASAALVGLVEAIEGSGCRPPIGVAGVLLVAGFGGAATAIVLVSGHIVLKASQFVSAAAAMIELVLFATSPAGGTLVGVSGPTAGVLLLVVLGLSAAIGAKPELGLATVGVCLIAAEVALASTTVACERGALLAIEPPWL